MCVCFRKIKGDRGCFVGRFLMLASVCSQEVAAEGVQWHFLCMTHLFPGKLLLLGLWISCQFDADNIVVIIKSNLNIVKINICLLSILIYIPLASFCVLLLLLLFLFASEVVIEVRSVWLCKFHKNIWFQFLELAF